MNLASGDVHSNANQETQISKISAIIAKVRDWGEPVNYM
jgi:hypothetical protein